MNPENIWGLAESDVEALASQQFRSEAAVSVMSILCNWPVSARYSNAFLDIWAVADEALRPSSIMVYGCENPNGRDHSQWRDIGEFVKCKVADVNGRKVGLYHFSGLPVDEFVVRLTDFGGEHYYDNNGGHAINYRLRRYGGLQITCLRAAAHEGNGRNWILVFPELVGLGGRDGVGFVSLK